MSPLELLFRAKTRIANHNQWTRGAKARDVHGKSVHPYHQDACQWDAWGAVMREAHDGGALVGITDWKARDALIAALPSGWTSLAAYCDAPTTKHEDIMALFGNAATHAVSWLRDADGREIER